MARKHRFGRASIKMYDKLGCILRIEITTNDVRFFMHTKRWNIDRDLRHENSPLSRRPSTA